MKKMDKYTAELEKIFFEEIGVGSLRLGSDFIFNAYNNEGALPHFHFKCKNGIQGCIRLDVPKYFCHENYHDGLNSKYKKKLVVSLTFEIWKKLVDEWNKNRTENLVSATDMPNYNSLPNLNLTTGKLNKEDRL